MEPDSSLFEIHKTESCLRSRREKHLPAIKVLRSISLLLILFVVVNIQNAFAEYILINEDFQTLESWTQVTFPQIDNHTEYEILAQDAGTVLVARSNGSASGIRYNREFNVYDYPVVRWRWKVENVYAKGNLTQKKGNDFPLRVYIMFKQDDGEATLIKKGVYELARMWYGEYPPHSSLNYIWANRLHGQVLFSSPYTDRSKLIIVRSGQAEIGKWLEEEVDILNDYQKAFGTLPPKTASIAIMNDSDNTGESSVSYLDYIQVLRKE